MDLSNVSFRKIQMYPFVWASSSCGSDDETSMWTLSCAMSSSLFCLETSRHTHSYTHLVYCSQGWSLLVHATPVKGPMAKDSDFDTGLLPGPL